MGNIDINDTETEVSIIKSVCEIDPSDTETEVSNNHHQKCVWNRSYWHRDRGKHPQKCVWSRSYWPEIWKGFGSDRSDFSWKDKRKGNCPQ